MEFGTFFIILAVLFGCFMAWGIGANDVANAMGTSVGSRALTLKQAIIIAAVFEVAGAVLAGGEVANTIRGEIIDPNLFVDTPELLIYGMLASLLAAGTWLFIATHYGWPVSTTHTIIGAIIGFAAFAIGFDAVNWSEVSGIFGSWVITPFIAGLTAYLVFRNIQKHILHKADPIAQAQKHLPFYIFILVATISMVTLIKGLKHLGLPLTFFDSLLVSAGAGIVAALIGYVLLRKIQLSIGKSVYDNVENAFGILMIFAACAMAFAHGSNDVANAIGPMAAVIGIVNNGGDILEKTLVPGWILILGGIGIMLGLMTYGYRVIKTIGQHITDLTPSRGFAANLATSLTVVVASGLGLPISTTQTLVGAVLGVGFARGIASLNINVIRSIFTSWIITLPAGAIFALIYFYILQFVFSIL